MSQDEFLESVESGFEDSLSRHQDIDASPTGTVLQQLQRRLLEQNHEIAKLKTSEFKLNQKLKEKKDEITQLREQVKALEHERESNLLREQSENREIQKQRILAKGKESDLALQKLLNRPLEAEITKAQIKIDELQKQCHELEQANCELKAKNQELESRTLLHSNGKYAVDETIASHEVTLRSIISLSKKALERQPQDCRDLENRETESMCSPQLPCSSSLVDREWEENVRPRFCDIVRVLKLDGLLDRLYEKHLLTTEEYQAHLTPTQTERERVRLLLINILPFKGKGSFGKFCLALRQDENAGTRAIADLIDKS